MDLVLKGLKKAIDKNDWFLINRFNFELFSNGEHKFDFHKTYTNKKIMRKIIEKEQFFKIEKFETMYIENKIVPTHLVYHCRRS
jgi:hypothetical protein